MPFLTAVVVACSLAGCGTTHSASSPAATAPSTTGPVNANAAGDARYTEAQVAKLAGLRPVDGGLSWTGPHHCQVSVIMTTPAEVNTYAQAGDAVVSNPAGDVGVKFFPDPGCRRALLAALRSVK